MTMNVGVAYTEICFQFKMMLLAMVGRNTEPMDSHWYESFTGSDSA